VAVQAVTGDLVSGRGNSLQGGKEQGNWLKSGQFHENCRAVLQQFQSHKRRIPWDVDQGIFAG
jgi:hypothetical protein